MRLSTHPDQLAATSSGTFGADEWTGSGTGQFAVATSNFTLDFISMLTVGVFQGAWNVQLEGTFVFDAAGLGVEFTDTTGTVTFAGAQETDDKVTIFGIPGKT